ncbi:hypothetical protein Btru_050701 [Bulinus truncatus]|nr:hypothetical protein Btru_050701 [Bulinus truncatus]
MTATASDVTTQDEILHLPASGCIPKFCVGHRQPTYTPNLDGEGFEHTSRSGTLHPPPKDSAPPPRTVHSPPKDSAPLLMESPTKRQCIPHQSDRASPTKGQQHSPPKDSASLPKDSASPPKDSKSPPKDSMWVWIGQLNTTSPVPALPGMGLDWSAQHHKSSSCTNSSTQVTFLHYQVCGSGLVSQHHKSRSCTTRYVGLNWSAQHHKSRSCTTRYVGLDWSAQHYKSSSCTTRYVGLDWSAQHHKSRSCTTRYVGLNWSAQHHKSCSCTTRYVGLIGQLNTTSPVPALPDMWVWIGQLNTTSPVPALPDMWLDWSAQHHKSRSCTTRYVGRLVSSTRKSLAPHYQVCGSDWSPPFNKTASDSHLFFL